LTLSMRIVAVIDSVDANVVLSAESVFIAGHAQLELLAAVAQLSFIRTENPGRRNCRITPCEGIDIPDYNDIIAGRYRHIVRPVREYVIYRLGVTFLSSIYSYLSLP